LDRLNAWLGESTLKQGDLAKLLDTEPSVVSKALSGQIPMSLARLRALCSVLGKGIHELFAPGPTVIEHRRELSPAEIAIEMKRLSEMLLRAAQASEATLPGDRFAQTEAEKAGLTEEEFAREARVAGQPHAGAGGTKRTVADGDTPDGEPEPQRQSANRQRRRHGK
jgi:transcriptional regulator with XRE-family HTH domain